MKKAFTFSVWIWFVVVCKSGLVQGFSMTAPTLNISGTEYSLDVSNTLTFTCRGQRPLGWSWPGKPAVEDNTKSASYWSEELGGRIVSIRECDGSERDQYCKTFMLMGARANDTGYYRCFYHFIEPIVDGTTATSIYVFVKDFQNPFVNTSPNGTQISPVLIVNSPRVTVPCLVSIPFLNVTLRLGLTSKTLYPDGKDVIWNNKEGMIVSRHKIEDLLYVSCETFVSGIQYKTSPYFIQVTGQVIYKFTLKPNRTELVAGKRLVLNCTVEAEFNVVVDFQWEYPGKRQMTDRAVISSQKRELNEGLELSSTLVINNITTAEQGTYICRANNGFDIKERTAEVIVHEKPFIHVDYNKSPIIEATVGQKNVYLPLRYRAYPQPEFKVYKNGKFINKSPSFNKVKLSRMGLMIGDVTEQEAGNYTVVLRNSKAKLEERLHLQLVVNVPPQIHEKEVASPTNIYPRGSRQTLTCTAYGIPAPVKIQWSWRPWGPCGLKSYRSLGRATMMRRPRDRTPECRNWRDISTGSAINRIESIETSTEILEGRNKTVSKLVILAANISVMYNCSAFNKVGRDDRVIYFYVTSIPEGFGIDLQPSEIPVEGEDVKLRCNADNYTYENLRWYRLLPSALEGELGDPPVLECKSMHLFAKEMKGVMMLDSLMKGVALELQIPSITLHDEGDYVCEVQNKKTGEKHCHRKYILVRAQEMPSLLVNLTDISVNISDSIHMNCKASGTPHPTVIWFKDEKPLHEVSGVILSEQNQMLTIQRAQEEDAGLYKCFACNSKGCVNSSAIISVEGGDDKSNIEVVILVGTGVIAVFFWVLLILIFCNVKRVRFLGTSPADIKTGYLSIIMDPDEIPLDEQCEYLPYDSSKWEFPRDRLRLGKTLGHGAFGKVVEASAFGIDKSSSCKTVAVKMLKDGATANEHKALMSELKILIHIGNHLNVVNLLGACTKANGPLMVIVEYCKYGNLSNYLRSKREDFIPYRDRAPKMRNQVISMVEVVKGLDNRSQACPSENAICKRTAVEKILCHPEELVEVDDLWQCPLTLVDLICYSFQVARGMEFLASRKCIHRDLAARNILLSENNVVKICDFGLARDIYKDPDYVRKGNARLPLKWMAPESIFDKVYTTQSDVWSFGVLLWEIFSLGVSPYPGVQINEEFCQRLREGTRMRAPEYATAEIYRIMLSSWQGEPKDRPTFSDLVELLGDLLQANVQQDGKDYIPLSMLQCTEDDLCFSQPCSSMSHGDDKGSKTRLRCDSIGPRYYNCVSFSGHISGESQIKCPSRVKTFEDVPVEETMQTMQNDNQTDSGMVLASEELEKIEIKHKKQMVFRKPSSKHTDLVSEFCRRPDRCRCRSALHPEASGQTIHSNDYGHLLHGAQEHKGWSTQRMDPTTSENNSSF
ncbi:vascular endothelial growth factor receptor 3 isoform X1 [Chiloscyllium plagiosum]|uniref:vascular endothelial growth factor receptor 3 isoform X1 n=1 Tax=Chiloscyllium plagiosum TaxID=36176 RepID=UPI001CB82739|nr:vascular endothelial growth factor receptor 3 isoform X1 [Chiloscyllium plagiosum]